MFAVPAAQEPTELTTESSRDSRYEALLGALETLALHDNLTARFHELAQRLRKVVDFDFINVMLHDPAANVMRLHVLESEQPTNIGMGPNLPPQQTPGGWAWRTQEPLVISDYEQETRFPDAMSAWRGLGMRSGHVHYRDVKLGRDFGAEVVAGIKPGELVVVRPGDDLPEGQQVVPAARE